MSQQVYEFVSKAQGPILAKYRASWARVSLIRGPLGSGKTIESCQKLFTAMCNQEPNKEGVRPSRWVAVRNTYPDLTSTTIKDWLELYQDLGRYVGGGLEPPTHHLEFELEDGTIVKSQVIFLALDRPDAVKKLRGFQCTGFWLNEVKELAKAVVDMADLRHGRYPSKAAGGVKPTWHGMIGDTNAPDEDHWYYKLAEEDTPEGWNFYTQPGGVIPHKDSFIPNPEAENIKNLPEGYYIRGMAGKSKDWIKVNLANEYGYVTAGRPVYPEYSDSMHCAEEHFLPIEGLPICLGWDFGLTPSCIIGQQTTTGQIRIIKELISENMDVRRFARDVVKPFLQGKLSQFKIGFSLGDPAGDNRGEGEGKTAIGILNDDHVSNLDGDIIQPLEMGFVTEPAPTNDPTKRLDGVRAALTRLVGQGEPGFIIDKRCNVLRKGFMGGYAYKRVQVSGEERYRDKPDKNDYSHPHDALQYLVAGFIGGYVTDDSGDNDDYHEQKTAGYW